MFLQVQETTPVPDSESLQKCNLSNIGVIYCRRGLDRYRGPQAVRPSQKGAPSRRLQLTRPTRQGGWLGGKQREHNGPTKWRDGNLKRTSPRFAPGGGGEYGSGCNSGCRQVDALSSGGGVWSIVLSYAGSSSPGGEGEGHFILLVTIDQLGPAEWGNTLVYERMMEECQAKIMPSCDHGHHGRELALVPRQCQMNPTRIERMTLRNHSAGISRSTTELGVLDNDQTPLQIDRR
ncbi:hypothetical protein P691DRAFT_786373 [Macrolepiota fuliginosa MF-IS2]|uniref:Uncharacterized protein n=1 Tax=Macrolepiota fuliginosa MF-IS2 TaxID=1400762 RepID=A0A9P5X7N7_9AGAR|nr:hypothetical protein P691DRAFT_786373 [Macrolepiota fuliginosa MF-IS2]